MFKLILFFCISTSILALEISLTGAKEDFQSYSTLHFKDNTPFLCQEIKDDFDAVTQIVCAFPKKPAGKIKELQNGFFKIENKIKNKTFFLIVTPFKKIKLYPIIFNMTTGTPVYQANVKMAKHWMVLGFNKKAPFIKNEKNTDIAINFPYESDLDNLPYVGSLDIKGNPVHLKRVGDISEYLKIKKLYKDGKYEACDELIDDILLEYPNSLFKSELLFYKIKVYHMLKDNESVIELSKTYLREYSSDENIPEVLAFVANAYALMGLNTDADYFFDRLFSEHADSEFANWGYIYKAEMSEASGSITQAITLYKKALNDSNEIDIAATAAYKLAQYYMLNGNTKEASIYIDKIAKAKPSFFMDYYSESMDMMYQFADTQNYLSATTIAKAIVDELNKSDDEYERLLKDRAIWLSKTKYKKEALVALNEYLEQYKYGTYEDVIEMAKDELFFDTNDGNFSVKLKEYNDLIQEYSGDSIGNRAIYEKSKLLLDNKMYADVLGFKDSILNLDKDIYKDTSEIIKESAIGEMKVSLENRKCQEVLNISSEYNITLSSKWDNGVYECSMMGADYELAKKIAARNINSKDIDERKKWLYRYIKVDFATGNYTEVIKASKDLMSLIEDDKKSKYIDVIRVIFDTYDRLENSDKLIESIMEIQKIYGIDYKDIERYVSVMSMGFEKKDDNIVIKYGEDVMKIQNDSSSYAQSPFVEFTLYQSYINIEDLEKALNIIKSLDKLELSRLDRARQKYLLGSVLAKLWRDEEAQKAYQEAIEADKASPWAKLAQDAKSI